MRTRARVAALLAVGLALTSCGSHKAQALPTCTSGAVALTLEQAANAATIAAVGKRLGMPDHAVTIALATALQESKLRNLHYGDRDSLGLFQQRPSQGWGTPAQVQDPVQASTSFYRHLSRISGWEALPVTVAAQRVQHSGAPDAYAQWEAASRQLAQALTGELPAAFACQFQSAPHPGGGVQVQQRATVELGPGGLSRTGTQAQTWTTASWLVAQASTYGLSTVSVSGMTWTAKRGTWLANPKAAGLVWS
ncbi:MAG: hypothetical protein QOJ48_909 [Frankiales bacterium]|nr:hypothetical protein [Frankiales bacterium]